MKQKLILTFVLALIVTIIQAQEKTEKKQLKEEKEYSLNISYYSINITQPGIKIGYEKPFKHFDKTKTTKKGFEKTKRRNLYYNENMGYYNLPNISNNFFVDAGLGYRRLGNKGLIAGVEVGLMAIISFNAGKTYEVDSNGDVDHVRFASNEYIAPRLNLELGYEINKSFALSIKPGVFMQIPHYKSYVTQFTFETTLKYQL